jgi:hypothetical protein
MARDEAPAATTGGINGKRNVTVRESIWRSNAGLDSRCGPTSLVAAEIHLGRMPADIFDGWLHCNIQVACHIKRQEFFMFYNNLFESNGTLPTALPLISNTAPKK